MPQSEGSIVRSEKRRPRWGTLQSGRFREEFSLQGFRALGSLKNIELRIGRENRKLITITMIMVITVRTTLLMTTVKMIAVVIVTKIIRVTTVTRAILMRKLSYL